MIQSVSNKSNSFIASTSNPLINTAPSLPPQPFSTHPHVTVTPDSIVSFKNDKYPVKKLYKAGKVSGKYKSCYNIEYLSLENMNGQKTWSDLDKIDILLVENSIQAETLNKENILSR